MTKTIPARRLAALAATTALAGLGWGTAHAQEAAAPSSNADLQGQVGKLTELVRSLAEKDQAEIQALKAQVQALQTRLDAQAASQAGPSGGLAASPRVAQNAPRFTAGGSASPADQTGFATPRVAQNETHHFALQSDDGKYSIGLAGVVQFDAGAYTSFTPASKVVGAQALSDGVNARRARIGVAGTAAGGFSYAFLYDGGNSQDTTAKGIETAQIVYGGIKGVALELGYSNTLFTLDQSTSGNDLVFLERSSPSDIATAFNAGDFRSNVGVRFFSPRYFIGGYLTGPASGDSHTTTGERFGAFERVAYQLLSGPDYSLHLGFGADQLLRGPNAGVGTPNTLALSDQPELRIDPTTFLNTGTLGTAKNPVTGGYVLDLETAAAWKGLFWQGEYYKYDIDRLGLPHNRFDGYYGQLAYTLTGETHRYNPQAAAYYRIFPSHPFNISQGDWGAWEIAGRFSYVDLNSNFIDTKSLSSQLDAVDGGKQTGASFALNWYPNDIIRFMLDYDHVDYKKANGTAVTGAALGAPVGAKFDSVSLRSQVVF
jgi:phosphate-selective porin OprO and OprP